MSESKSDALPLGYTPIKVVEEDGFEPPNPLGTDLQSAAFDHFAIPPYKFLLLYNIKCSFRKKWWMLTGSNRRPTPCKGVALPTELSIHLRTLNTILALFYIVNTFLIIHKKIFLFIIFYPYWKILFQSFKFIYRVFHSSRSSISFLFFSTSLKRF